MDEMSEDIGDVEAEGIDENDGVGSIELSSDSGNQDEPDLGDILEGLTDEQKEEARRDLRSRYIKALKEGFDTSKAFEEWAKAIREKYRGPEINT